MEVFGNYKLNMILLEVLPQTNAISHWALSPCPSRGFTAVNHVSETSASAPGSEVHELKYKKSSELDAAAMAMAIEGPYVKAPGIGMGSRKVSQTGT